MLPKIPGMFHFTKVGKPLKEVDPDIIVTWGKFAKTANEWLQKFRAELTDQQYWYYSLNNSYFGYELLNTPGSDIHKINIYSPTVASSVWPHTVRADSGNINITFIKTNDQPIDKIRGSIITPTAVFHSWPDINGKFKIFLHKSSRIARFKYKCTGYKTYIDRENLLTSSLKWNLLEEYIQACTISGLDPQRKDICDLVRTISEHEVEIKQRAELIKVGMIGNSHELL